MRRPISTRFSLRTPDWCAGFSDRAATPRSLRILTARPGVCRSGLQFGIYELVKVLWIAQRGLDPNALIGDIANLVMGLISGTFTQSLTCPLKTVAIRIGSGVTGDKTMAQAARNIYKEGGIGEQEFSSWSDAGGAADSWSPLVPLEPEQMKIRDEWRIPSHTSTLVPSTTKLSRVHAIYMWNGRNITTLPSGERCSRNDDMGGFALKFTDDGGASWSAQRWPVPLRVTAIDRDNTYAGKVALIYGGSRHLHVGGQTYIPFNKFRYCCAETNVSEAFALVSDNIATAATPAEIRWRLLPSGERGLGVPGGGEGVAEEAHMLQVGNSSSRLLMLYRSARGMLGSAYSSDGGSSFEAPQWLPYDANAATPRVVKNPRGSFTPFRSTTDPSLYLMIYYNNAIGSTSYGTRWTYWLTAGRVSGAGSNATLAWSEPEVRMHHLFIQAKAKLNASDLSTRMLPCR